MQRSLTVVLTLALVFGGSLALAQTDVAGDWTFTISSDQGTNDAEVSIMPDGETLKGTLASPQGELPFEGTVSSSDITLTAEIDAQGQLLVIDFNGTVDGSNMEGTVNFGDFASGDWTAVKN